MVSGFTLSFFLALEFLKFSKNLLKTFGRISILCMILSFLQMEEAEPPESEDEEQYTQRPDGSMKKKVSTINIQYSFPEHMSQ
jgi:hypothetical protein